MICAQIDAGSIPARSFGLAHQLGPPIILSWDPSLALGARQVRSDFASCVQTFWLLVVGVPDYAG